MQKSSFLFLLILAGVALIGAYNALFPLPAGTMLIRFFALSSLFIICVALVIGPLAVIDIKYASLIEPRRAIGIAGFVFAATHILLALGLVFGWQLAAVLGAFPILISIPAALILLAMTLTSSDWAVQKLGMGSWKTLQMLIYPAFVLILAHFMLQSNGLFAKTQAGTFVNLAEVAVLALSIVAIILQFYGFYLKKKRLSAVAAPAKPA
jgi:sulfoxide reductase heme-binding subunit YedZ